jgi:hypothetical protein
MQRAVQRVGTFHEKGGYWECVPDGIPEGLITFQTPTISEAQELRAQKVCASWSDLIAQCLRYIEERRNATGLEAHQFDSPHVIIGDDDWIVFFETESETETDVGVDFRGETPFQLVIGD